MGRLGNGGGWGDVGASSPRYDGVTSLLCEEEKFGYFNKNHKFAL